MQFFEDCFEWEQISYKLFPYYWADQPGAGTKRRDNLFRKESSGDPIHDAFRKAGFAKVIIPVRPEREENVLFFLETNHIWKGTKLPVVNKPKYRAYLDELHESKQLKKGEGIQIGEPWEVKLPTNFVILQNKEDGSPDGQLPMDLCKADELADTSETNPDNQLVVPKIPTTVFENENFNEISGDLNDAI